VSWSRATWCRSRALSCRKLVDVDPSDLSGVSVSVYYDDHLSRCVMVSMQNAPFDDPPSHLLDP
jgi:hypothetical protein